MCLIVILFDGRPLFLQPHLEATVNPVTLSLVGDQSKDLLEYLDNSKDRIKHEITSGVFEFKMNGMIRIPNPNYNPKAEKAAKRARTEGILSNVSVEAMEQVSNKCLTFVNVYWYNNDDI